MSNKILVLGATGNVGTPLVHLLKKSNANFCVGIQPDSKLPESIEEVKSVFVDYNELSTLEAALTGIDIIFILIPDSPQMVSQAKNIKKAILKNNVFRYIYLSGLGVKLAPDTWLSQNLLKCENALSSSGIPGTVLRPTFFMQNFLNHYPPSSDNKIALPIREGKINYIDVNDVAYIAFKLLTNNLWANVTEFNITGTDSFQMVEIANLFSKVMEKEYEYVPISLEESKRTMQKNDVPEWLINMLHQIFEKVREDSYAFNTQDFQLVAGRKPKSLKAFVKKNQAYFNQIGLRN